GWRPQGRTSGLLDQMKTTFSATASTSAPVPSNQGARYQASSPTAKSSTTSVRLTPQTRPRSSCSGFGCVTSETPTVTTASATNATSAPAKFALCAEPKWTWPIEYSSWVMKAPSVPATSPANPAHGVDRRQNMPMMNVANSGALKYENSSWT